MHFVSGFSVTSDELFTQVQRQGCKIATSLSCSIVVTGEKCSLPIAVPPYWSRCSSIADISSQHICIAHMHIHGRHDCSYKPAVRQPDTQLLSCRDCSLSHACSAVVTQLQGIRLHF